MLLTNSKSFIIFSILTLIITLLFLSCTSIKIMGIENMTSGKGFIKNQRSEIMFRIEDGFTIFLDTRINNSDDIYSFIFDTGGMSFIDTSLTKKLNLEKGEILDSPDGVGNMYLTSIDSITFHDKMKIENVNVISMPTKKMFGEMGMLGPNLIRFFKTSIDYSRKLLIFDNNDTELTINSDNETILKMEIAVPYHPTVQVEFDENISSPCIIDTGSPFAFVLPIEDIKKLSEKEKKKLIKSKGNFGKWPFTKIKNNYLYKFDKIKIGDITLKNQAVLFADLPSNFEGGLIGKHFLENYITTLDFKNKKIKLSAISDKTIDSFNSPIHSILFSVGISLVKKDNILKVRGIWENSPSDRAGIFVDDEIITLNNISAKECTYENIYNLIYNTEIKEFKIQLKRNKEIIKLKKENLF